MTALTIPMQTIIDRAYQTALEDELKTTVTAHDTDEGCLWVQRDGQKAFQVWPDPFTREDRCTCGWFKIAGFCSHIVSAQMARDLWWQEAEHEEREEGRRFMEWCARDRAAAEASAANHGDYLSDPFAE